MARRDLDQQPVATLQQLRRTTCWLWLCCEGCHRSAPMPLAPLLIRWGDVSSDVLRQSARCTRCGRKGATLQIPSWVDSNIGMGPMPIARN